jgi:hypothetical protein
MIFISHSSRNNDKAIAVRDWLVEQGWGLGQIYLDLDDLNSGERWRHALNDIGSNCEAVIACLSDDWLRSPECIREFNHAESGGKPIFPLIVESITVKIPSFISDLQFANIVDETLKVEGFERLRLGLLNARIGPQYFPWPPLNDPDRSVYRGLKALEEQDAAILFGRDVAIAKGLDDLRLLRGGTSERALVVLGASGAGKSSFLRAGLIARLKREDHHFLVLPVIRPERAVLSGAFGLEASLTKALGAPIDLAAGPQALTDAFTALREPVMQRLRRVAQSGGEVYQEKPPTIVVPIDQAEELYNAENLEAASFLALLTSAFARDANALAIFTIRSDSYGLLQADKLLEAARPLLFSLPPIAIGEFKEVIEGPARLARPPIEIEHELTQQLLADLDSADALPLLAFTLARFKAEYGPREKLTLADYRDRFGGLNGAIRSAVDGALGINADQETLALARRAFVPALVQVDHASVKRRIAELSGFPFSVVPLIDRLVTQRLLVSDHRSVGGTIKATVEVAHEAILRQWPALAGWIEEERDALRTRDLLVTAAEQWRTNGATEVWLVHRGTRLADAAQLTEREDFAPTITADARAYLSACFVVEKDALERVRRERTRRQLLIGIGLGVPAAIGAGVGGIAMSNWWENRHFRRITFDDVAVPGPDYEIAAGPYLKTYGVSVSAVSPDRCHVLIKNNIGEYSGQAAEGQHFLTEQADPRAAPMSFTLGFDRALKSIRLVRASLWAATTSGISHPAWTAQAFDATGKEIAHVSEALLRSFTNVPAKIVLLQSTDTSLIASLKITSDFRPDAGFQAALIKELQLAY